MSDDQSLPQPDTRSPPVESVAPYDPVQTPHLNPHAGIIAWFARNHVATNLLMVSIILLGIFGLTNIRTETMPNVVFDQVIVRVPYLGAAPEEVEEGVVVKIEDAVRNVEGVKEIRGTAAEGLGAVTVEVLDGYDINVVMDDIKVAVDGISTFPGETEKPVYSRFRYRRGVITVQVWGALDEASLKSTADRLRDEIVALPEVSAADVWGGREYEIAIEVHENTLRQYGLTLEAVAQAVRTWSLDLPGGIIKAEGGDIRLRTKGQAYRGDEFANIVLLTRPDGTRLRLSDVATITDGFVETHSHAYFNGKPSLGIAVFANDTDNEIDVAAAVRNYVEERTRSLSPGIEITPWADNTYYLNGRIEMLTGNMIMGAFLVFVILWIFLDVKVAGWVILGLPVSFLGAFMLLPLPGIDVSINALSLFGFILVLGIIVDDAIVVAEAVHTETRSRGWNLDNIIVAAKRVAKPVTFGVLTTVMAFLPMLFVTGPVQAMAGAIGWVVILCLLFSLVESKLMLPSHLAITTPVHHQSGRISRSDGRLKRFVQTYYRPLLTRAIEYRYLTIATFLAALIISAGAVGGGYVRYVFFPEMGSDYINATVELNEGVDEDRAIEIVTHMNQTLEAVNGTLRKQVPEGGDVMKHVFAFVENAQRVRFQVELARSEDRLLTPQVIEKTWRDAVGEIPDARSVRFESSMHTGGGPPIAFKISGADYTQVDAAGLELSRYLREVSGVFEVESTANSGPQEIRLRVKPEAEALGLTLADLARQVRVAFYGAEAQRVQRGNDEVKVMVRYPREARVSLGNLESMWIRTPDGRELPFAAVADYTMDRGVTTIQRIEGQRALSITARSDERIAEPAAVMRKVQAEFVEELQSRYPEVDLSLTGSGREERLAFDQILVGFMISLFGIYALLAIPLKSYAQPLIIMGVIPFGIVGAIFGHFVMDAAISAISLFGIIALSGVVVNDSLLMVDYVNTAVAKGQDPVSAAIDSGMARFRAILLTSLTTFFGLAPMLAETSVQAQMVMPMAISLSFGIVFSTVITLILVPVLYVVAADLTRSRFTSSVSKSPSATSPGKAV
ncbi:MAG: efflux RND transporter permease subunit [Gammaproteobacteria bacterium]|nr:efflux RND transporter permease subunit [Gammaproteobacteria bacterium]